MIELDKKINEQYKKSTNLRRLEFNDDKMSYEKTKEIQKQQNEEWNKLMFFKNLKKELLKDELRHKK